MVGQRLCQGECEIKKNYKIDLWMLIMPKQIKIIINWFWVVPVTNIADL